MRDAGCTDLIQLPFVIGNGDLAQLCVVRLESNEECKPKVYLVKEMKWKNRQNRLAEMLSMLAYLLGKALKQMNDESMEEAANVLNRKEVKGNNIISTTNNQRSTQSKQKK